MARSVIRGSDKIKQTEIYRYQQVRLDEVVRTGGEEGLRAEIADLYRRARLLDQILHPEQLAGPLAEPLARLHAWGGQTSYALVLIRLISSIANLRRPTRWSQHWDTSRAF